MKPSKQVQELIERLEELEKANDRLLKEEIKHLTRVKKHVIKEHIRMKKYEQEISSLKNKKNQKSSKSIKKRGSKK